MKRDELTISEGSVTSKRSYEWKEHPQTWQRKQGTNQPRSAQENRKGRTSKRTARLQNLVQFVLVRELRKAAPRRLELDRHRFIVAQVQTWGRWQIPHATQRGKKEDSETNECRFRKQAGKWIDRCEWRDTKHRCVQRKEGNGRIFLFHFFSNQCECRRTRRCRFSDRLCIYRQCAHSAIVRRSVRAVRRMLVVAAAAEAEASVRYQRRMRVNIRG